MRAWGARANSQFKWSADDTSVWGFLTPGVSVKVHPVKRLASKPSKLVVLCMANRSSLTSISFARVRITLASSALNNTHKTKVWSILQSWKDNSSFWSLFFPSPPKMCIFHGKSLNYINRKKSDQTPLLSCFFSENCRKLQSGLQASKKEFTELKWWIKWDVLTSKYENSLKYPFLFLLDSIIPVVQIHCMIIGKKVIFHKAAFFACCTYLFVFCKCKVIYRMKLALESSRWQDMLLFLDSNHKIHLAFFGLSLTAHAH